MSKNNGWSASVPESFRADRLKRRSHPLTHVVPAEEGTQTISECVRHVPLPVLDSSVVGMTMLPQGNLPT